MPLVLAAALVLMAAGAWAAIPPQHHLNINAKHDEDRRILTSRPIIEREVAKPLEPIVAWYGLRPWSEALAEHKRNGGL